MAGQGRLAIVAGASSGFGLQLARLAADEGYDLVAAASVLGGGASAGMHRFIAEPGTALKEDKSHPR